MGTSADYGGLTGGGWTSYKVAVSNYARNGGGEGGIRAQRVLSRYVAARGGADAIAGGSGGRAASSAARGVAGLIAGVATDGLGATLESLGLAGLVGKDRYEVLDGLISVLAGDGATRDEQAVVQAVIETLERLFPEDAQTFDDLDAAPVIAEDLPRFVETFLTEWAYWQMAPTFEAKFATGIDDAAEYAQREDELRQLLGNVVALKLGDRDPLSIDWRSDEGKRIVDQAITDAFAIIEEDYEG